MRKKMGRLELSNKEIELLKKIHRYTHNLNPIERVWKFFKKEVLKNRFYPTFKEFEKAIEDFFQKEIKEESMKEKLRRFVSDNFHIRRDVVCLAYPSNGFQLNYFGK
ncbi:MAG: hypothetical protein DRG24_09565 [Epsilonproteobacteria bacterium]|nr:MAG: hypothetical protein DRG24_09565 [Campylobacterota bacterium]